MLENHMVLGEPPYDDRPVICDCSACGHEICGPKGNAYGDPFYDFMSIDGSRVHANCLHAWAREHDRDGSDEDAFCEICNENNKDYVHYNINGTVLCDDCLEEWAEDFLEGDTWL